MIVWTLPVPAMSSSSIYTTRKDRRKPIELIVHLLIRRKSTVEKLQFKEASILGGGRQEFVHYCAGREEEEGRKKGESNFGKKRLLLQTADGKKGIQFSSHFRIDLCTSYKFLVMFSTCKCYPE
jgi:hypothetical protein